jgi:hypothetical protein
VRAAPGAGQHGLDGGLDFLGLAGGLDPGAVQQAVALEAAPVGSRRGAAYRAQGAELPFNVIVLDADKSHRLGFASL